MSYVHKPAPPLSEFIAFFWLHEGHAPAHPYERLMPSGEGEFIFSLNDQPIPIFDRENLSRFQLHQGAILYGAHSEPAVIATAAQSAILGIHFKPGGLFPFFGAPAHELHNAIIPFDLLWGRTADDMRGQLLAAPDHAARFRILERYFLARLTCSARSPVVRYALREFRQELHSMASLSDKIGLSQKRFIQLFRDEVGMTPKRFSRLLRFNGILRTIHKQPSVDWADMAVACGYYDQAHFIHDFSAFSGFTPGDYLTNHNDHFGHVPLNG